MTVSKSGFEPVAATVLLTFCEKLRTVPSDHFRLQPAQGVARTATRAAGAVGHHAADNNAAPKAQGGRDQATVAMNIADEAMRTLVAWLPLGPA